MVSQSDKVTKALLDCLTATDRISSQEVAEVLEDRHGADAPSIRTVRNRLEGLEDVGVLVAWGGGGRNFTMYSLRDEYREGLGK